MLLVPRAETAVKHERKMYGTWGEKRIGGLKGTAMPPRTSDWAGSRKRGLRGTLVNGNRRKAIRGIAGHTE